MSNDMAIAREMAELLMPPPVADNPKLIQAVISSVQYGTLTIQLGGSPYPVGGIRYLGWYSKPKVGDSVWVLKNGPDLLVLGPLTPATTLEPWKKIGTSGSVFNPAFTNLSASESGGGFAHGAFYKDPDGWVHLKGLVNRPSGTGDVIAQLPVGYRPGGDPFETVVLSNDVFGVLRVWTDGVIQLITPGATSGARWVNLCGVQFYAGNGTFKDLMVNTQQPNFLSGFDHFSMSAGRMAMFHKREIDGLCRAQGFSTLPASPASGMYVPSGMEWRQSHLFGAYFWNGATGSYGRCDGMFGSIIFPNQASVAGGSSALCLGGFSWMHQSRDQDFTAMSMSNSWTYYGAPWNPPGYLMDSQENVQVRGLVRSGVTTIGTVIGTLPLGYRPPAREMFHGLCNGSMGRFDVLNNGQIIVANALVSASFSSLDNIFFRAGTAIP